MRKLIVFNNVTLDGYFTDASGDMSWAHQQDPEWNEFMASNASGGGELVFGRVTYDLMAGFWPTPMALQSMPLVAERMNHLPKIVFSKTMHQAAWNNTRLIKSDIVSAMKKLKEERGDTLVIMGSGNIVAQLTSAGLIDEYQIVIHPIALGDGKTLFDGIKQKLDLKLTKTKTFGNGNVFLCYERKA
jgi:dihydrofolate reductase